MAFMQFSPSAKGFALGLDTEKALRMPIGAASPLWLAFAGAASAGVAFWWMSRWMRPVNLEAFLSKTPAAEPVVEPVPLPTAPESEPVETVAEAVAAEPAPVATAAPTEPEPAPLAAKPAATAMSAKTPKPASSKAAPKTPE